MLAGGADHPHAALARELHGRGADAAGRAVDHDRLPRRTPPSRSSTRAVVSTATGSPAASSNDSSGGLAREVVEHARTRRRRRRRRRSRTPRRRRPRPRRRRRPRPPRRRRRSPRSCGSSTGMTSREHAAARFFQSIAFTLAARTAIRICPGPACGSSTSATRRTSGSPYSENCTAFMQAMLTHRKRRLAEDLELGGVQDRALVGRGVAVGRVERVVVLLALVGRARRCTGCRAR